MLNYLEEEKNFDLIKEEIKKKLDSVDKQVTSILEDPENNKKHLDIIGYIEKYNREINHNKRQEELENKLKDMEKSKFLREKEKTKKINLVFNGEINDRIQNTSINVLSKSAIKRLKTLNKNSHYTENNENSQSKNFNMNLSNKSFSQSKSRKHTPEKLNTQINENQVVKVNQKEDAINNQIKEITNNSIDNKIVNDKEEIQISLNKTKRDFIASLDETQLKNFLQKKELNQPVTKYDIKEHIEKIEKQQAELKLNKKLEKAKLKEHNKEYLVHNNRSLKCLDMNKLQRSLISINKENQGKPEEINPEEACYLLEKQLKLKKLHSINIKIQRDQAAKIIKELVPVSPNPIKQRELEERIKKLNSPKNQIEILKLKSFEDPDFPIKIDPENGYPIVPDYLEELRGKSLEKLKEELSLTRKPKLKPIVYSPTTQVYAGRKSEKTFPRKKLDNYPDYMKHSGGEEQIYLNEEQNLKKWNNIISNKKGSLQNNINTLKLSLKQIDEKIQRNNKVIMLKSEKAKSSRLYQEQGNLLVESINAKLAILNSVSIE